MPTYDGQKYACDSCIKGHRVSGCQHTDRELKHIAPKGRPVKQCEHCRGARKNKSHHAKCDCGDKKDKLKGDIQGEAFEGFSIDAASDLHAVNARACRCHYGAPCICGVKKGPHDLSLDAAALRTAHHPIRTRPKLTTARSENTLMVFANGHHKPSHRLNNAVHTSGAPYKIPRPHSLHGPSLPQHSHSTNDGAFQPVTAQFSADDLMLSNNHARSLYSTLFTAQRSLDSLPLSMPTNVPDRMSTSFNSTYPSGTAELNAPNGSPGSTSPTCIQQTGNNASFQWPWTSSEYPLVNQANPGSFTTSPAVEGFNPADLDWSSAPAALTPFSANDLPLNMGQFDEAHIQPISNSGESGRHSAPGLTASSSGSQSELGDAALFGDLDFSTQRAKATPLIHWDGSFNEQAITSYHLDSAATLSDIAQLPTYAPTIDDSRTLNLELFNRNTDNDVCYPTTTAIEDRVACGPVEQDSDMRLSQTEPLQVSLFQQPLIPELSLAPVNYGLPACDPVALRPRSNTLPPAPSNDDIDWVQLFKSNAGGSSLPYQPLQPLDIEPAVTSSNNWQSFP